MSQHQYQEKTSVNAIKVANERLYIEVGKLTKTEKAEVEKMITFLGQYIYDLMKKGDMEGIMIPLFGKFRPKARKIKAIKRTQMNQRTGMDMILRAVKGKVVIDYRPKEDNNETI